VLAERKRHGHSNRYTIRRLHRYNGKAEEGGVRSVSPPGGGLHGDGKMGDEASTLKEQEILFSALNKF